MENGEIADVCNINIFERFILLLSCAGHDLAHPGNNNAFEVNSKSELALTYNDKSVLENYSLFVLFSFLNDFNMNIFKDIDAYEGKYIRKTIIKNIIATDMANHFTDLKKLQSILKDEKSDLTMQENKEHIMSQIIHLADISNSLKQFEVSKCWVDLLFKEFYNQVKIKFFMFIKIN
jgi:hypothetical protein